MADPDVREIGRADIDGHPFAVGIDHGTVTLAFPGVRAQHAVEQLHGGRFPCAVLPDDAMNGARLDPEIHAQFIRGEAVQTLQVLPALRLDPDTHGQGQGELLGALAGACEEDAA